MTRSGLFQPIAAEQLFGWVFSELDSHDSIFGIPRQHFFVPTDIARYSTTVYGQAVATPFGPAAGPHSQLAQNIVAAWLCGARYIELKTVQTLDELDVPKPCIDMEDEGYNVEWSQELKIHQSVDEYLRAWVLIHALHHKLGFPGAQPATVFNLSVGYDLEGIVKPNMQWFLGQMRDCSTYKQVLVDRLAAFYPPIRDLEIPDRVSDNVTLSTMHGCPPDEIESISTYLMRDLGLHTLVKCNPTLLGPDRVRTLLNEDLKYTDVAVPDSAFEHDLAYADAVPMLRRLQAVGHEDGLVFGVKLSNTLEVENSRSVFDASEPVMYLSGRPLHAITVNLADRLNREFDGRLPMSFSAGANCFNAPRLLASGMQTVTVCSDLLKTGGYLRLLQYTASLDQAMRDAHADNIDQFIVNSAGAQVTDVRSAARHNLHRYAQEVASDPHYMKGTYLTSHTKTGRDLRLFDCIEAPCLDECPLDQKVPQYIRALRRGDLDKASGIIRADNPLPCTLGRICDHLCEQTCVRTHVDEPVAIRDIKRFIMDQAAAPAAPRIARATGPKVAIIGAGPGGMAAAAELAKGGATVEMFERAPHAGGMVGGVVPEYRLPRAVFDRDFAPLTALGVHMHLGRQAGRDFDLSTLRRDGFDAIVIMVGAQLSKTLGLAGEDCDGVIDALEFLRRSRQGRPGQLGQRIGIIGAGDTAMDCARVAWRSSESEVTLIYRRTIDQMPADREEVEQLIDEGIEILELCKPQRLVVEDGRLRALVCRRTFYSDDRDASGRKIPHEVPGFDFEVPLDTLIMAVSQAAALDFFGDEPVAVNEGGYIAVDPVTFETSVHGVYAGGDVVNEGPASIVKAAAAGKAIAASILGRSAPDNARPGTIAFDTKALLGHRAHRAWRVPAPQTPPAERHNFDEVMLTYSEQQARAEAERCLDCDTFCSLCVGVCPNLALQTWQSEPFAVRLPQLSRRRDDIGVGPGIEFRVDQAFQVAVVSDFCNECGNCTTFCPTAGRPFSDKPRLFLDRAEFEAQPDNAFMMLRAGKAWVMEGRWHGATHRIELDGALQYIAPTFRARLDPATFEIEQLKANGGGNPADAPSLEPCAVMYVLLKGLARSVPWLPLATPGETGGRMAHPGYPE